MNLADILKEIGNEGHFQIMTLLILAMPKMPIQWSMTIMSFVAYAPNWCCVPENVQVDDNCQVLNVSQITNLTATNLTTTNLMTTRLTATQAGPSFEQCKLNSSSCSRRIFLDKDHASTAVTEMAGVMVGAFASGSLADEFGRKRVHFATILIHGLLNIGAGLSNSWMVFAVFRFFIGATIGGYLVVHVPYILEFVSPRWRVIPASLPFASIGASLLPFAAWLLPDWRWMHFICAMFCAPFLLGYFYLPESVRWLTVKGRVEEACAVVDQIAKINKKEYNCEKCMKKIQKVAQREQQHIEKGKKYSYADVYRGWKMARLTLTLQFVWFTTSLVGYGIILGISSLAGNIYVNMFLVEAVEIPFIMATYYFNNCIGRRYTALVYFCLAALSAFLALVFHLVPHMAYRDMTITMMCIGCRTFVSGAAAVFIVVSTEVYPTVIRTLGFGAANTAAKVGGVLAPFIINMDAIPSISYSVMFATCLLCVAAVLSLHETKNLVMEDTLENSCPNSGLGPALSCSLEKRSPLRRSKSQPRIIIDFDVDLIHQRSYSEFEDDNDDDEENDELKLVRRSKKRKEKSPLLRQRHLMYDPMLATSSQTSEDSLNIHPDQVDEKPDVLKDAALSRTLDNLVNHGYISNEPSGNSDNNSIQNDISSTDNSVVNGTMVTSQADIDNLSDEIVPNGASLGGGRDGHTEIGIAQDTQDTEGKFVQ